MEAKRGPSPGPVGAEGIATGASGPPVAGADRSLRHDGRRWRRLAWLTDRRGRIVVEAGGSQAYRGRRQVILRIDGRLNVQHQMDVFDELKSGGVRDVGIVTDAPKQ